MITTIKKAVRDPSLAFKILRLRTGRYWGHRDYRKFIVLGRNRTGSNLLISMLNSHPSIYAVYEIFRMLNGNSVDEIMNNIYLRYPRFVKAVGFKIFYHHPVDDKSCAVWNKLTEMEDLNVIHLKRRNILRSVLSKKIAHVTEDWLKKDHRKAVDIKDKRVHLYENELLKAFKQTRKYETTYEQMFSSNPMIEVYYEDLVSNPLTEFQKITDFLNLKYYNPKTTLKKQNPESMSDLIINYELIKRSFADTVWLKFFED